MDRVSFITGKFVSVHVQMCARSYLPFATKRMANTSVVEAEARATDRHTETIPNKRLLTKFIYMKI